METPDLLGKGIYSFSNAARIVDAYPQSVRRWSEGYSFKSRNKEGRSTSPPLLLTPTTQYDEHSVLTFEQLVEILFVRLFRAQGVAMPVIRAAALRASRLFDSEHPFAFEGLKTDGREIFHIIASDVDDLSQAAIAESLAKGQMIMADMALPYFRKLRYDNLVASQYWPLGEDRKIVIDPERSFGEPIDASTGTPTRIMYGRFNAGDPVERVAYWYNASQESVRDAIEFETQARQRPGTRFAV